MTEAALTPEEWGPLLAAQDLETSPGHTLRVLENKIHERYYQLTPRADISPRQCAVLLKLTQVGSATQTELAALIHLDRSTLSEMSNRMCERGLLKRAVHEADRRATTLQVSEAGHEALLACFPSVLRAQRELLAPLPDEYRPLFQRCLTILYRHHTRGEPEAVASSDSAPTKMPAEPTPKRRARTAATAAPAKRAASGRKKV